METMRSALLSAVAGLLLVFMAVLAGGAAWHESVTVDEVAHIGAGVSYLQKLDLRLNEEHPLCPKCLRRCLWFCAGCMRTTTIFRGHSAIRFSCISGTVGFRGLGAGEVE